MDDPIGFFFTWVTYGTWLPGDSRGWVEHRHGWRPAQPALELESAARMTEDACWLSHQQRKAVEDQVAETCLHRRWRLHAANCRTNHLHAVVSAPGTPPKKIRADLKAWATRRLKLQFVADRKNWWAERGSTRWLWAEDDLDAAVQYVAEGQGRRGGCG
ncbi:transposase [Posidoniimonas corsicana]|nr:transposase [Posidoniimonas corsicana]